jgi:glycosyltransferase involved in cell wall biosynthesis
MNLKKILFVSHEASHTGAPVFLVKLVQHLQTSHVKYSLEALFCDTGDLVSVARSLQIPVFVSVKRRKAKSRLAQLYGRFSHYLFFCRLLFSQKPDLIYSNTMMNFGEVFISRIFQIPIILHVHEGRKFAEVFKCRLWLSCKCASRIIAGSAYAKRVLNQSTSKFVETIYNGVTVKAANENEVRNFAEPLTLGILGTIDPNKGQIVLLEAVRLLLNRGVAVQLKIAGRVIDPEYQHKNSLYANAHLPPNTVDFTGFVPSAEAFIRSIDILIVASYDEVLPTVILDAFALRTLVIASNVGGIPEIIQHGVNGLLFTKGNAEDLAAKISSVIDSPDIFRHLLDKAFETASNKFNANRTNGAVTRVIDDLLKA